MKNNRNNQNKCDAGQQPLGGQLVDRAVIVLRLGGMMVETLMQKVPAQRQGQKEDRGGKSESKKYYVFE